LKRIAKENKSFLSNNINLRKIMKKLLLIVALIASMGQSLAMEQAELTQRKNTAQLLKFREEEESVKIEAKTRCCLHCCATCIGCCCGLAHYALLLSAVQHHCQNSQK
jgi:hypothetical protein